MKMTQYIDKAAVVAEIKRRINVINHDAIEDWYYRLQWEHDIGVMKNILSFIDTLEVKEVNLECKDQIEESDAVYFSEQAVRNALMKVYTNSFLLVGDSTLMAEKHAKIRVENVINKMKGE